MVAIPQAPGNGAGNGNGTGNGTRNGKAATYMMDIEEEATDAVGTVPKMQMWLAGGLSAVLVLVIIVMGALQAGDDGASKPPCIELEYPAGHVPGTCAPATSQTLGGVYPDFLQECKAQTSVDWECPAPFPTFAASSETAPDCKLAVVGAGTGGLYTALRLVDAGKLEGQDICIFELDERVGGRIYSLRGLGPMKDLSVDVGAYRTWPRFTPVTHALITEYLGLKVECYRSDEDPCEKFIIVDDQGNNAGFTSFVEEMMKRLVAKGVRYFPFHEAVALQKTASDGATKVVFANGVVATATHSVVLNIPQRPLLELIRNSSLPDDLLTKKTFQGLHGVQSEVVTKLYLYYPVAWWHQVGLKNGEFQAAGDAQKMLLKGRYHDGEVHCADPANPATCHGFLLAVYAHDYAGEAAMYFRRFQSDRPTPVTILSNSTVEGKLFLAAAHKALVEQHKYGGMVPYMDAVKYIAGAAEPSFAVLATWNIATRGAGGGWHGWTDLKYKELAENPLTAAGVYLINEAFSNVQGWAEGSLQRADEVLTKVYDVTPPWSFTVEDVRQVVMQTTKPACEEVEEASSAPADAGGDEMAHLCFAGDARLALEDGSTIPLHTAAIGMRVMTGAADGRAGKITAVLKHLVHRTIPVAVLATAHGAPLVGSREHPVLVNGEWMELAAAHAAGAFAGNSTLETRYVDFFYNLEIDGDKPGASAHAYVVNDVVASGNGDSPVLNARFPRQDVWKAKRATLPATSVVGPSLTMAKWLLSVSA